MFFIGYAERCVEISQPVAMGRIHLERQHNRNRIDKKLSPQLECGVVRKPGERNDSRDKDDTERQQKRQTRNLASVSAVAVMNEALAEALRRTSSASFSINRTFWSVFFRTTASSYDNAEKNDSFLHLSSIIED